MYSFDIYEYFIIYLLKKNIVVLYYFEIKKFIIKIIIKITIKQYIKQ